MYTLQTENYRYGIDENGDVASLYHCATGREYIFAPGGLWKLIYAEGERVEIPVCSHGQAFAAGRETAADGTETLTLTYDSLQGDGRTLNVKLTLRFTALSDRLLVTARLQNNDDAEIKEIQLTAASGIRSLSGNPGEDTLTWPKDLGFNAPNPAFSDLSTFAGFRKYERHDQFHTDMDGLYPGRLSMSWMDLYNEKESLYVGCHDGTQEIICMHAERDVKENVLRLGAVFYPFLKKGQSYESPELAYAPQTGGWHAGAKLYRSWIESQGGWKKPEQPEWVRQFKGWLRVILKQHHCELNWDYSDIPALYDETEAAGMDTLFLLGWEKGGFARMWPDYVVDERMGGEKKLREGIEYVHAKGGKVLMFLSYLLIDHQSEFYKSGKGRAATAKSIWGEEIPFSETYCGEGTYRKIGNPPMPMFWSCPHSDIWQEKMLESAKYCLDLGADGVLYDIGGAVYFCFDETHGHARPSLAYETKARNYRALHDYIRSRGEDKIILMEHNVDIFASSMDISQGMNTRPTPTRMPELYRYTFPECIMTNRECGEDEENYRTYANYSVLYGLRFDMTIHRCCSSLSAIPNYAAYLGKINALRAKYSDYLLTGRFLDDEGFTLTDPRFRAKSYRAENGDLAILLWNPQEEAGKTGVSFTGGVSGQVELPGNTLAILLQREGQLAIEQL